MRTYPVATDHDLAAVSIADAITEYFGDLDDSGRGSEYSVQDPDSPIAQTVHVQVHPDQEEISLDIETLDVDTVRQNDLLDEVPQLVQAKNAFLEEVTGRTVEDRKQEMFKEVLPLEEDVVECPMVMES